MRNLDLRIEQGERVLLLGTSGAGKSTLLAALAGLLHPPESGDEEGSLLLYGHPASAGTGEPGLVFQDPSTSLVMARSGDEVAFGLENLSVPETEIWPRATAALKAVGFEHPLDHPTSQLSGGEQQRLAIADVLAMSPRLWLLDEPTANLDPEGAALVRDTLQRVVPSTGATLVLVEHRVEPVLDLVDRAVVIEAGGGVVADGAPADIFRRMGPSLRAVGVWAPGAALPRLSAVRSPGPVVARAEALSVRYPGASGPALRNVDISAHCGQVLAVTGPNGSGKSTLALALASLVRPTSGTVRWEAGGPSKPYPQWPARELVRWVGTVFQEPEQQFVSSTVAGELAFGPRRAGVPQAQIAQRVDELLDRLGLAHLAPANPFTLSGGEKRRLSVATALATRPLLLVLDEPTFGQDARTWGELANLLAEQRDDGKAVVAVTHDQELVSVLADAQARLERGQLVAPVAAQA